MTATTSKSTAANYSTPFFIFILLFYVLLGHKLETNKSKNKTLWVHESGPAVLLGGFLGVLVSLTTGGNKGLEIDGDVFFYFVLPPIIFAQAFGLKKRNFFKYVTLIFSFGVLGTVFQFAFMTWSMYYLSQYFEIQLHEQDGVGNYLSLHEAMVISATLTAADEISILSLIKQSSHPKLSAILFGEGVLNDSISILLFHSVCASKRLTDDLEQKVMKNGQRWLKEVDSGESNNKAHLANDDDEIISDTITDAPSVSPDVGAGTELRWDLRLLDVSFTSLKTLFWALFIGVMSGLVISRILKQTPSMKKSPVHQTAVIALGAYLSFSLSDAQGFSGVLTVFFTGVTLSHYAWHSLSSDAKTSTKITFASISQIAEAYCYAAVGVSLHRFTDPSKTCWTLVGLVLGTLILGRFITIFGLGLVFGRRSLPLKEQVVLFAGGLVRGAICWAQAITIEEPHRYEILSTTMAVILFTTLGLGSGLPFVLKWVLNEGDDSTPEEWHCEGSLRKSMSSSNALNKLGELNGIGSEEDPSSPGPNLDEIVQYNLNSSANLNKSVEVELHNLFAIENEELIGKKNTNTNSKTNSRESTILTKQSSNIKKFDVLFMKPYFGGRDFTVDALYDAPIFVESEFNEGEGVGLSRYGAI